METAKIVLNPIATQSTMHGPDGTDIMKLLGITNITAEATSESGFTKAVVTLEILQIEVRPHEVRWLAKVDGGMTDLAYLITTDGRRVTLGGDGSVTIAKIAEEC
jgi:hypothetical protein